MLFHGGVPAEQRGALVDRFTSDAQCRLFLSTDAGGVGLNLQHAAATVVNMDLPWNPAKLEQRIGRVHRIGQRRGVQVINLVAQGSIEEGMLGVLAFKQSLFAGVLDGGDSAVFMNGTRLSKFMESVDAVTGGMGAAEDAPAPPAAAAAPAAVVDAVPVALEAPQPAAQGELPPVDAPVSAPVDAPVAPATANGAAAPATPAAIPAATPADPWLPLLDLGLRWLAGLADTGGGSAADRADGPQVLVDPATGARRLSLPMPAPDTLQRVAKGLAGLLAQLQR